MNPRPIWMGLDYSFAVEKENKQARGLTAPCSALPGPMIWTHCTDSRFSAFGSTASAAIPSTRLPHGRRLVRILLVGRGRLQHAQSDRPDDLRSGCAPVDGREPSNLINNNITILFWKSGGPRLANP